MWITKIIKGPSIEPTTLWSNKMQGFLLPYLNLLISVILRPKAVSIVPTILIIISCHQLLISKLLTFFQSPLWASLFLKQVSYKELIDFVVLWEAGIN